MNERMGCWRAEKSKRSQCKELNNKPLRMSSCRGSGYYVRGWEKKVDIVVEFIDDDSLGLCKYPDLADDINKRLNRKHTQQIY